MCKTIMKHIHGLYKNCNGSTNNLVGPEFAAQRLEEEQEGADFVLPTLKICGRAAIFNLLNLFNNYFHHIACPYLAVTT